MPEAEKGCGVKLQVRNVGLSTPRAPPAHSDKHSSIATSHQNVPHLGRAAQRKTGVGTSLKARELGKGYPVNPGKALPFPLPFNLAPTSIPKGRD